MNAQRREVVPANSSFTPAPSGLLQRKCACGNHTMAGGECAECGKTKRLGLQTKRKVNEPGDIYEQEADRIADQAMATVMATPAHSSVNSAPPRIQRFSGQSNGQMDAAPASVDQALASTGSPLEPALRQDMEQRFGYDFSRVRVHSDAAAEQSAWDVNAHAYTVGHDMVFATGRFAPGTHEGRRLIAHELTHVVQQSGADGIRAGQGNEKGLSPVSMHVIQQPACDNQQHRPHTLQGSTHSLSSIRANSNVPIIQRKKEKKKKEGAGKQIVIIANGYPGYASEKREVEDAQRNLWLPNTPDFSATAFDTQKGFNGASTADEFFGALQSEKDKIKRVAFIGHGNPSGLGLSGRPLSWFEKGLVESDIVRWQANIDSDIKPKLLEEATLDVYACNVAAGGAFMKALAQSLGICVRGFSGPVFWCLGYKDHAITGRGRIAGSFVKTDCSGKGWFKGVNKLTPPVKVCS